MPEDQKLPTEPGSPDIETLRHLVRLMHRYDLTAIDLGEGPTKIRLRRRGGLDRTSPAPLSQAPPAPPSLQNTGFSAPATPAAAPVSPAPEAPKGVFIESPMVGTYYSASSPDAPPFVQSGAVVRADSTVCVIEAMKVFTDIPAGLSGTIVEILVKNGQPVEFGQPLFRIEPS